jgi:haloacetate dehalogenase
MPGARACPREEEAAMAWFEGFETTTVTLGTVELHARFGGRSSAPPVLLLHGYPQTHAMWHRVAQRLAPHHRLIMPDLRGYGDSAKPAAEPAPAPAHAAMSKRAMAADVARLMSALGHERFAVVGHDRGARVAHRLALDHRERVTRLALLDVVPTFDSYAEVTRAFATLYYHWFFLIQPHPLPERLIGADPAFYLRWTLGGWGGEGLAAYEPEALAEYERCFCRAETIHACCEDYRAGASIDLVHDGASRDAGEKIGCDALVLWGARGVVGRLHDPLALWQAQCARPVRGEGLEAGHFLAEERPDETARRLLDFLGG